jgi:hypothetical protein
MSLKSLGTFEHVESEGVDYLFGTEPADLNHKHVIGFLVSTWGKDPKVTSLEQVQPKMLTRLNSNSISGRRPISINSVILD